MAQFRFQNSIQLFLTLNICLLLASESTYAKCFSDSDPDGKKQTLETVKATPVFVKGKVANYKEGDKEINFDIEVIRVFKGKNVPNKIFVVLPKYQISIPAEKKYEEGKVYIFPINQVGETVSKVNSSSCFPDLNDGAMMKWLGQSASSHP